MKPRRQVAQKYIGLQERQLIRHVTQKCVGPQDKLTRKRVAQGAGTPECKQPKRQKVIKVNMTEPKPNI